MKRGLDFLMALALLLLLGIPLLLVGLVVLLRLLHIVVELAGLGEHALDPSGRGRAAKELGSHLGQVRQTS